MKNTAEYLVIGAGPAGLQLGYFFEQNGRDYLILERGDKPGYFFEKMPRHRMLISINKVFTGTDHSEANLRWDWNSLLSDSDELLFKNYSQDYFPHPNVLVNYLKDFADHYREFADLETEILAISLEDEEGTEILRIELDLPYPLLTDPEGRTTEKYTYWQRDTRAPLPSIFVMDRYANTLTRHKNPVIRTHRHIKGISYSLPER